MIYLWMFVQLVIICDTKGDTVSVSCDHVIDSPVNVLTLATSATYNISQYAVNVTATSSSNVFIRSTCCANMTLTGAQCSRVCTLFGLKMCRLQNTESLVLNLDKCLYTEYVNVSCVVTETKSTSTTSTTDMTSSMKVTQSTLDSTTVTFLSATADGGTLVNTSQYELTNMTGLVTTNKDNTNSTTDELFDEEAAINDLYTFLIVVGVILLLVVVLVVGFFLRKRREKGSISRADCALDFWHNYSDHVVEKRYCPSSTSFTVNPVYNSSKTASDTSSHRYRHREEQKPIRHNEHGDLTGYVNDDVMNNANADDTSHSAYSVSDVKYKKSDKCSGRDSKYAEKYVASAAGSNFYSYRKTPEVEPSTNLDDDECFDYDIGSQQMYGDTGSSSFKPPSASGGKEGKRKRRGERRSAENGSNNNGERQYADSYRNRLRKHLDDWSAEESDV